MLRALDLLLVVLTAVLSFGCATVVHEETVGHEETKEASDPPTQQPTQQRAQHEARAFEYKVDYDPLAAGYNFSYSSARPKTVPTPGLPLYDLDAIDRDEIIAVVAAMRQSQDIYTYIESYADSSGSSEEVTHALALELYRLGIPIERIKRREKLVGERQYLYLALATAEVIW